MVEIKSTDDFDFYVENYDNVLFVFHAEWDKSSTFVKDEFKLIEDNEDNDIILCTIDIDDNGSDDPEDDTKLVGKYEVKSIPLVLAYKEQKQIARLACPVGEATYKSLFEEGE